MRRASAGRRTYNSTRGRLSGKLYFLSLCYIPIRSGYTAKLDQIETFYLQISWWIELHSHLMQCLIKTKSTRMHY